MMNIDMLGEIQSFRGKFIEVIFEDLEFDFRVWYIGGIDFFNILWVLFL